MLSKIRTLYRLSLLGLHACYAIILLRFAVGRNPTKFTARDWYWINHWTRIFCKILGIRITVRGEPHVGTVLYASNHITWHDIAVLHSMLPVCFIAKDEIRRWPLVGWLAYRGGTLFVRRGGARSGFDALRQHLETRLAHQQSVLFFPEGTTSSGLQLLKFKHRLFGPAIEQQCPVQPIGLRYSHSEKLAFIGKESFMAHMLRTLGEKCITVEVFFCTAIGSTDKTAKILAEITQQHIAQKLCIACHDGQQAATEDRQSST